MPVGFESGQVHSATDQAIVTTLAAGSSLLRARLSCYTSFVSSVNTAAIQFAPANTLFGIYWAATGGTIPLITTANRANSIWYVSGYGEMTAFDRSIVFAFSPAPAFTNVQHNYASFVDLDIPNYQAGAFDVGFSFNFLGAGFWTAVDVWVTYQLTYWWD
jgi:hypothetical protein